MTPEELKIATQTKVSLARELQQAQANLEYLQERREGIINTPDWHVTVGRFVQRASGIELYNYLEKLSSDDTRQIVLHGLQTQIDLLEIEVLSLLERLGHVHSIPPHNATPLSPKEKESNPCSPSLSDLAHPDDPLCNPPTTFSGG